MAKTMNFSLVAIVIVVLVQSDLARSDDSVSEYIYHGCSRTMFLAGSLLESSLSSLLTSMSKAVKHSSFNYSMGWINQWYALFQCCGDISRRDCAGCIDGSVSRLRDLCPRKSGGSIQLEGCFVRYDTTPFIGELDKSLMYESCGPSGSPTAADSTRNMVLERLSEVVGLYSRVGGSLDVNAVAQCTGDLDASMCQDCIADAIGRLQKQCSGAVSGDMFLGKCYARFASAISHATAHHHPIIPYYRSLFMLLLLIYH